MNYSLSVSKTALLAELVVPNGTIQNIIGIKITPDYGHILNVVNKESAVPLDKDAIVSFTQLFLSIAHAEQYESKRIYAALDSYVKDAAYLIEIGVQKVHQAFTLRTHLLIWLETTRFLIGYAAITLDMPA